MWVLEFLVWFFAEVLWWRLGYAIGRQVLSLVSFGKMRAGPYDSFGYNWFGCKRDLTGHLEIESTLVAGVGLITCFVALAVILYFIY